MATNNDCTTCIKLKKKHKSSVICIGCQKPFCKDHHQEHRKSIDKDFEGLLQQHNILRQNLYNENTDENSRISKLLKIIDNWEKEMMNNIKATATANRIRLTQIINDEKDQLKNKFQLMADELKTNQSLCDYVEPDIQEWQKQISECKQKLEQLQTWNNDFVNIDIKPINWNNSISIQQRKDVCVRTTTLVTTKRVSSGRKRKITCLSCNGSFYEDSGYTNEFCTITCANDYAKEDSESHQSDNDNRQDDDEGDGCFHGSCVASLANGSTKLVKDIRKGDVLKTPDGSKATIIYVVKILNKKNRASMVTFENGLIITPWHPIRVNDKWIFPHDIKNESVVECSEMYNFVLDSNHIMIINGIECVTLGHGFKGEVIEHPYYGTTKVLDDLHALDVKNDGFIELLPNSTVRDNETGLVSGICSSTAKSNSTQFSDLSIFVQ